MVLNSSRMAMLAVLGGLGLWMLRRRRRIPPTTLPSRLVAITGCDCGVGFSAALHSYSRGFFVVAFVLNMESKGAQELAKIDQSIGKRGRIEVIALDVTKPDNVTAAVSQVENILANNDCLVFHALINNAGVMVFGETEWQTDELVTLQMDVNLSGPIRVTRTFAPLLRRHKGRVINVTSHCATVPLPGFSIYAASKAGLLAWSDALRIEWAKYGINVVSFVPGGFFDQTNIMGRQAEYGKVMLAAMSEEAAVFYGEYFSKCQQYMGGLSGEKPLRRVDSPPLYRMLCSALEDLRPHAHYENTPPRYGLYHRLASLCPTLLRDRLVARFTALPAYTPLREERFQSKKKGKGKKKEDVTFEAESENDEKDTDEKNESEEELEDKKTNDSQTTEESEEEALVKKTKAKKAVKKGKKAEKKAPPTDEEIKTYVKSLLDGANLEQITMKKVCQQVDEHYPDFDLGQKKDFIKTTVKSLISS